MIVMLPITTRASRFGYVFWRKQDDALMRELLGGGETIQVRYGEHDIGRKRIDWKYRRISIGRRLLRSIDPRSVEFRMELAENGHLQVTAVP